MVSCMPRWWLHPSFMVENSHENYAQEWSIIDLGTMEPHTMHIEQSQSVASDLSVGVGQYHLDVHPHGCWVSYWLWGL